MIPGGGIPAGVNIIVEDYLNWNANHRGGGCKTVGSRLNTYSFRDYGWKGKINERHGGSCETQKSRDGRVCRSPTIVLQRGRRGWLKSWYTTL